MSLIMQFPSGFCSAILYEQLSSSKSPRSGKMAAAAPAICSRPEKKELSLALVKRFPNIPADRLVSTSHWQPLSAIKARTNILLLGLFPYPTK